MKIVSQCAKYGRSFYHQISNHKWCYFLKTSYHYAHARTDEKSRDVLGVRVVSAEGRQGVRRRRIQCARQCTHWVRLGCFRASMHCAESLICEEDFASGCIWSRHPSGRDLDASEPALCYKALIILQDKLFWTVILCTINSSSSL